MNSSCKDVSASGCASKSTTETPIQPHKLDLHDAAAKRLASRLFHLDGFNHQEVTAQLLRRSSFYDIVAKEYLMQFNFQGLSLLEALRMFLAKFSLAGESQEKERILQFFSQHYVQCHPDKSHSQETCHLLACALLLLNMDLHNQEVQKKMTCSEFVHNFTQASAAMGKESGFSRETLRGFYDNIKKAPLLWPGVNQVETTESSSSGDVCFHDNHVDKYEGCLQNIVIMCSYVTRKCIFEGYGKKTGVFKRRSCVVYMRLCGLQLQCYRNSDAASLASSNGSHRSKSPAPQHFNSSICGDVQDDKPISSTDESSSLSQSDSVSKAQPQSVTRSLKGSRTPMSSSTMSLSLSSISWKQIFGHPTFLSPSPPVQCAACISVHHALAFTTASSHVVTTATTTSSSVNEGSTTCLGLPPTGRRPEQNHDNTPSSFVFRLYTADGAQYLFHVASEDLLKQWIKAINYTTALLSSPPLPCPVGSQCNSFRPIYQCSYTTLSLKEQIQRYKEHLIYLKAELMRTEAVKKNLVSQTTTSRERLKDAEEKIAFLVFEIGRFQTYLDVLQSDADGECECKDDLSCRIPQGPKCNSISEGTPSEKSSSHLRTNSVSVLSDLFSKNCPTRASTHRRSLIRLLQRKHMS